MRLPFVFCCAKIGKNDRKTVRIRDTFVRFRQKMRKILQTIAKQKSKKYAEKEHKMSKSAPKRHCKCSYNCAIIMPEGTVCAIIKKRRKTK